MDWKNIPRKELLFLQYHYIHTLSNEEVIKKIGG